MTLQASYCHFRPASLVSPDSPGWHPLIGSSNLSPVPVRPVPTWAIGNHLRSPRSFKIPECLAPFQNEGASKASVIDNICSLLRRKWGTSGRNVWV